MANKNIYFFSKTELFPEEYDIEKIGIRGKRATELAKLLMPIVPGIIINSDIANKTTEKNLSKDLTELFKNFEDQIDKKFNDPENPSLFKIVMSPSLEISECFNIHAVGLTDETITGFINNVGEEFAYHEYAKILLNNTFNVLIQASKSEKDASEYIDLVKNISKANNITAYKNVIQESKKLLPKDFFIDGFFQLNFLLKNYADLLNKEESNDNDTAIIIQPIVYGNYGEDCYSGKFFTRNVLSGEKELQGVFNKNVFDLNYGKNEQEISKLDNKYLEMLINIGSDIECHFKEIRDIKFIVEMGKLWIIEQSSVLKKSANAEIRCLLNLLNKEVIDEKYLINKVTSNHISELLHPIVDQNSVKQFQVIPKGISGSPGAGKGRIYFNSEKLIEANRQAVSQGKDSSVILCLPATYAEDVKAIEIANGVLSNEGGYSAHASVVARQYGKSSLVNPKVKIDTKNNQLSIGEIVVKEGDYVTLDVPYYGEPRIILGNADLVNPDPKGSVLIELLEIINKYNKEFKVLGNADTPKDSELVKIFGGEGIGLCRTEHMFFGDDRINVFREMIVSSDIIDRKKSLSKIKLFQTKDFYEILKIMHPYPVTIRLLDAPLHEFLPHSREEMDKFVNYITQNNSKIQRSDIAFKCDSLSEVNPMLGHRGCRIAVTFPEIYEMQVNAIFEAAYKLQSEGIDVKVDIMIPLIMNPEELKFIKHGKKIEGMYIKGILQVEQEIREKMKIQKSIEYRIGVMIELPAAALLAAEISKYAEFFSFGTNDLTQTTHGISRDDFNVFLPDYSQFDLIDSNPFKILTEPVKEIIMMALMRGRLTRPDLKIGLCGEQGADPKNIDFLKNIGVNYVSCSSYSIPIAKLKIAQLEIE